MRERNKGFNIRCTPEFIDAMTRAAEDTGMTKTQIVEAAVASVLPLYFASSGRAAQPEHEVQNTHIGPFLESKDEAKRVIGRKKRPR